MSKRTYGLMIAVVLLMVMVVSSSVLAQGTDGPPPSGDDERVREDVVRDLLDDNGNVIHPDKQLAKIAQKHNGGFGGYYFDRNDRGHAYVYMKNPSRMADAQQAFTEAYKGSRHITRVTAVQGDYSYDDLVRWYYALDKALVNDGIYPTTGGVREIENRIRFGMKNQSDIDEALKIMSELEIPTGAVVFKIGTPRLF